MSTPFDAQQQGHQQPTYAPYVPHTPAGQQYQGVYTQPPAQRLATPPAHAQQVPAQELPVGTLTDFYNQPQSANGKSLAFDELGDGYIIQVSREIVDGDVRAQTDDGGNPTYYRDGRPKLVLVLPVSVYQSQTAQKPMGPLSEGVQDAALWVKGKDWAALAAAMKSAGWDGVLPEVGAFIKVIFVKKQKNRPPMNDTKIKEFQYIRPEGAPAAAPDNQQTAHAEAVASTPPAQLAIDTRPPAPVAQVPVASAPDPAPAPVNLTPEMAAKLAELTGGK